MKIIMTRREIREVTRTIEIKPTPKPKQKKSPAPQNREPSQSQKTINIINHN